MVTPNVTSNLQSGYRARMDGSFQNIVGTRVAHLRWSVLYNQIIASSKCPAAWCIKLENTCSVTPVVRQVHEYYAEFCAVNEDFFSANCPDALQLALPRPPAAAKTLLSRNRDAVLSVLLALKKKPSTIRYAVRGRESATVVGRKGAPSCNHYRVVGFS